MGGWATRMEERTYALWHQKGGNTRTVRKKVREVELSMTRLDLGSPRGKCRGNTGDKTGEERGTGRVQSLLCKGTLGCYSWKLVGCV